MTTLTMLNDATHDIVYIPLNKIPDTLKKTKMYKILSENHKNNPEIPIFRELYERELILSNLLNLSYIINHLSRLNYSYIPPDINYDFVLENKDVIIPNLQDISNKYPQLKYIQEITMLLTVPREKLLKKTIKHECTHLLNYCIKKEFVEVDYINICCIPVKYNNVYMLDYIYSIGGILNTDVCNMSIVHGSIDCLKYIANQLGHTFTVTHDMFNIAAKYGQLECLKYIYSKTEYSCPWNEITSSYSAEQGHLNMIKYMFINKCPIDEIACSYAAKKNHFEILKYLHEVAKIPLYIDTCLQAAINNNMEMLMYAENRGCKLNPIGVPDKICYYAALHNNLHMLIYAHKAGCYLDGKQICKVALTNNNKSIINYVLSIE